MHEPRKPTILCVDDDEAIRGWAEVILTAHGWQVETVDGGRTALQAAQERPPDVILLDVTMPDMNGYEVCAKLQEQEKTASIPVIFATARGGEDDKMKAFQVGAADYLVKPMNEKRAVSNGGPPSDDEQAVEENHRCSPAGATRRIQS